MRGGGAGPSAGAASSGVGTADVFSTLFQVARELATPILADPKGRLLEPARAFLQDRATTVQARQKEFAQNPQAALSFALMNPLQVVRLALTALLLSESLQRLGFLEDPAAAKAKIRDAFRKARLDFHESTRDLWREARHPGGWFHGSTWKNLGTLKRKVASMEPKHQMAVGLSFGLVLSPLVWSVAVPLVGVGGVAYVLAEANYFLQKKTGKSVADRMGDLVEGNLGETLEKNLEQVRGLARKTVSDPSSLYGTVRDTLERFVPDAGGLTPHIKQGIVAGMITGVALV